MPWLLSHKAHIGWTLAFLAGGIEGLLHAGLIPPPGTEHGWSLVAWVLGYVAVAGLGAGHLKSDDYYRDRQEAPRG